MGALSAQVGQWKTNRKRWWSSPLSFYLLSSALPTQILLTLLLIWQHWRCRRRGDDNLCVSLCVWEKAFVRQVQRILRTASILHHHLKMALFCRRLLNPSRDLFQCGFSICITFSSSSKFFYNYFYWSFFFILLVPSSWVTRCTKISWELRYRKLYCLKKSLV